MIYDLKQQTRNRRKLNLIKGIYGKPTADILLNVSKVKSISRQLPTRLYVSPFTPLLPPMPKFLQPSPSLPLTVPLPYCSLCSFLSLFLRAFVEVGGCSILEALRVLSPGGYFKSRRCGESVDSTDNVELVNLVAKPQMNTTSLSHTYVIETPFSRRQGELNTPLLRHWFQRI